MSLSDRFGATGDLRVVPANQATWADLEAVFGHRGAGAVCWCQRYKLMPLESFSSVPAEERAFRLRRQTECDFPDAETTSGLVAFLGLDAVGWCAVEPRPAFFGLMKNFRVPWEGRDEDKEDSTVWAVTCVFIRAGFRRRGISRALVAAAVEFARNHGARALEAYPMTTNKAIPEELHVGTVSTFAAAGLTELHRPTLRRAVMRIEFDDHPTV